jgi:dienelactone hydrolase
MAGISAPVTAQVRVPTAGVVLAGDLVVPEEARGIVVFAHGSGSGRRSPRNRYVGAVLQDAGLATLLFDLLTEEEERIDLRTGELRFDIPLLADRLVGAVDWVGTRADTRALPLGVFGASTGAAAALIAAAERPESVRAVVSRGGRPDLAGAWLGRVRAPTLLIVGGRDETVIELNRSAMARTSAPTRLEIVPEATHLFEEPGKLEAVAGLARDWFVAHLGRADRAS